MGIRDGIRRRRNEGTNLKSQGSIITKVNEDVGIGQGHHHIHQIIHHLRLYHRGGEDIMIAEGIGKIDMNQDTAEVEVLIVITTAEMIEEDIIRVGTVEAEAGVIVQVDAVGTPLDHIVGVEVGIT